MLLIFVCFILLCSAPCDCFQLKPSRSLVSFTKVPCAAHHRVEPCAPSSIFIDMRVSKLASSTQSTNRIIAYDAVYKEIDDRAGLVMDSPALKVLGILFNPLALIFALYFVLVGYTQVGAIFTNLMYVLRLKERDTKAKNSSESAPDVAFQVFQCDVCEMQMRPAKGRAAKIFGRERFRCARCGAKASSYFDIDDMSDERAVARRRRLEEAEARDDLDDE